MLLKVRLLLLILCGWSAQTMAGPQTQTLAIGSPYWTGTVNFRVTLPSGYDTHPDKHYSLLLDFNPRSQDYLAGLQNWLSQSTQAPWPDTIIVTPAEQSPALRHLLNKIYTRNGKWLANFIKQQLLPAINRHYRTNGYRIFSGFKDNANGVLYCLLHHPELFNAYIAISPNLQDQQSSILDNAEQLLAAMAHQPRFLQISTGNNEFDQQSQRVLLQFQQKLLALAPDSLDWHIDNSTDSRLMSQPILAMVTAMERIFADITTDLPADSAISRAGVNAIFDHYNYLSTQKYGFPVSAAGSLVNLAREKMANQPLQAIQILHTTLKHYPDSVIALHQLAATYAIRGQNSQAVRYQQQAVQLASQHQLADLDQQRHYLQNYQSLLSSRRPASTQQPAADKQAGK